jgi:hypothetical protein
MNNQDALLWGLAGTFLDQLLHWASIRHDPRFPTYARTVKYWIVSILLIAMGGVITLAYVQSVEKVTKPLSAMVVGFSGIALIKKLSQTFDKKVPVAGVAPAAPRATVRTFLNQ